MEKLEGRDFSRLLGEWERVRPRPLRPDVIEEVSIECPENIELTLPSGIPFSSFVARGLICALAYSYLVSLSQLTRGEAYQVPVYRLYSPDYTVLFSDDLTDDLGFGDLFLIRRRLL